MTQAQLRQKFVGIMRGWLGRNERDGSHKHIIDIYNSMQSLPRNYKVKYTDAWCATTVSAAAIEAGLTDIIPIECSCLRMIELLKKIGAWCENDAYVPLPGDIIFYDWNDSGKGDCTGAPEHVGVVEKVAGGVITVIEGNYADSVKRRNIAVNGRYIRGFGAPKFSSVADAETQVNTSGLPAVGDAVNFTGSVQYLSAYSGCASAPARACTATVTAIASGKQHPYHLLGNGIEGWADAADIEGVPGNRANPETIQVGDEVVFNGAVHYSDSYAVQGYPCKGGEARVKAINRNGTHAYCLESIGKVCTANGWVDAEFVTRPTGEKAVVKTAKGSASASKK